jgi:CO/xanthine dehydrogenase Mo-binding subunit
MVRDFSTGGGHLPGDTLIEGDKRIAIKKWQGYPPKNLKLVGKVLPPLPEVSKARFTGKAEYATRVVLPNMLYARLLISPHPRARIKRLDTARAEKMPGVAYILTHKNVPETLRRFLGYPELEEWGAPVAVVAAETADLAEDAVEAIDVEYEVLPFIATVQDAMKPDAPKLREMGNLLLIDKRDPRYAPDATTRARHGDVEKGFAESDIVKDFSYEYHAVKVLPWYGAAVAKWDGDKVTVWNVQQEISNTQETVARELGIPVTNVRVIGKYNGGTFGGGGTGRQHMYSIVAYVARATGRPVKLVLPFQELNVHGNIKPPLECSFKVGAKKDGRLMALKVEHHILAGPDEGAAIVAGFIDIMLRMMAGYVNIPNWDLAVYAYKANVAQAGCNRSCRQQEMKYGLEIMMDEMAEAVGMDPVEFRLLHVARPGQKLYPAKDWNYERRPEVEKGALIFDAFASVEAFQEGAKRFGWDKRNLKPGSMEGRFRRGMGVAYSCHNAGHLGYHEDEPGFKLGAHVAGRDRFNAFVEVDSDGFITIKQGLPDSGTNNGTGMAHTVGEVLGFTTREKIRMVWGDTDLVPPTAQWYGSRSNSTTGYAAILAAHRLKLDLLERAAKALKIGASDLTLQDSVIWSKKDPKKKVTFAELASAEKAGFIRKMGTANSVGTGRANLRGVGCIFLEVEVDTWTGQFQVLRVVNATDCGKMINPVPAEADQDGLVVQGIQTGTEELPYDREFPGQVHQEVGFLSYRIPTIWERPEEINHIFIESLEPRTFFGFRGFTETTIGAVPSALGNAIYNATGVRIREHPITAEKILAGLRKLKEQGVK